MKVAILASGNGSNLAALVDAGRRGEIPQVVLAAANTACRALERAREAGIPTRLLDHRDYPARDEFDADLAAAVEEAGAELVCLAGFMRVLGPRFLTRFPGRILNVHPSLLPAFPGLHAQRQALEAGVRLAGCTVHFVDPGVDTGAIIAQAAVPVLTSDTEQSLSERILAQEHRIFPAAVLWVSRGDVRLEGGRAVFAPSLEGPAAQAGALHSPSA